MLDRACVAGLALALAAGCGPCEGPACEDTPPAVYPVGVTTLALFDDARDAATGDGPRPVRTEVWYPALAGTGEPDVYDVMAEVPEDLLDDLEGVELPPLVQDAARDAELDERFGRFPLLLFSHGKNGMRYQTHSLMTHLAAQGFIVAAPDHHNDTLWELIRDRGLEPVSTVEALVDRPADVTFLIDTLAHDARFGGRIDAERLGVFGHSFGGLVSMLMVAEGSEFYEPRVRAALPLAPAGAIAEFLGGSPADTSVPLWILGGLRDATTPYETDQLAPYEHAHAPAGLVGILDAGHFSFTELCELDLAGLATDLGIDGGNVVSDGCGDDFIAPDAQRLVQNYFGQAFFRRFVRDEEVDDLDPELVPNEVSALVDYQVKLESP